MKRHLEMARMGIPCSGFGVSARLQRRYDAKAAREAARRPKPTVRDRLTALVDYNPHREMPPLTRKWWYGLLVVPAACIIALRAIKAHFAKAWQRMFRR